MLQKILGFLKDLFSEDKVKTNRSRIEKIESIIDPIITKEETKVEEQPEEETPVKKTRKKPATKKKKTEE